MAATTTTQPLRLAPELGEDIPPPSWGDQFGRMRKANYPTADTLVAELATIGVETTAATVSRIESSQDAPTQPHRQIVAVATMVLCRVKPQRLDLDLDVLPHGVYTALLGPSPAPGGQEVSRSAWNGNVLDFRARRTNAPAVVDFPHAISA